MGLLYLFCELVAALCALVQPFDGRHFYEPHAEPHAGLQASDAPPLCCLRADFDDFAFFQAAFGALLSEGCDHAPILPRRPAGFAGI